MLLSSDHAMEHRRNLVATREAGHGGVGGGGGEGNTPTRLTLYTKVVPGTNTELTIFPVKFSLLSLASRLFSPQNCRYCFKPMTSLKTATTLIELGHKTAKHFR